MPLVFFFIGIVSICFIITLLFVFSVLEIEIKNLQKVSGKKEKIMPNVIIRLYFLDKVLWFRKKINNQKMQKKWKKIEKKIDISKIEKKVLQENQNWKNWKQEIQDLQIGISQLNLKLAIGTEDAIITSSLVTLIASSISIILPHIADRKPQNYYYEVKPIYTFQNEYKLALDCIINVKMVHIISVIYKQVKKRRGDKHERTSNTRINDYCHE